MQPMPSIQRLPHDVMSQVKSSIAIVCLGDAALGLLKNSLDADATKISISVEFARGSCLVDDNGCGILPDDYHETGGLGKFNHSSRFHVAKETHGRHGSFLASLGALSLLTITSRHKDHRSHNSIRFHRAKVAARLMPALPEQGFPTFTHGTRVAVRDLFGDMPVRIKQRVSDAERGQHVKEFEQLKFDVVAVLLAWPGNVYVTLRDVDRGQSVVVRAPPLVSRDLRQPDHVPTLTARLTAVLAATHISRDISPESWIELSASTGGLSVSGAISLTPVATKRVQFISIGICPVANKHGSNPLYEEVNQVITNSDFGSVQMSSREAQAISQVSLPKQGKNIRSHAQDDRTRKAVERWPMFFLQFSDSTPDNRHIYDFSDEKKGILPRLLRLIRAVLHAFLEKHGLRPKRPQPLGKDSDARPFSTEPIRGPRSRHVSQSRSNSAARSANLVADLAITRLDLTSMSNLRSSSRSPFRFWGRIKSGVTPDSKMELSSKPGSPGLSDVQDGTDEFIKDRITSRQDGSLRQPSSAQVTLLATKEIGHGCLPSRVYNTSNTVQWRNPATDQISFFDDRTGLEIARPGLSTSCHESHVSNSTKRYSLATRPATSEPASPWLKELMSTWENPVFPVVELSIPTVGGEMSSSFGDYTTVLQEIVEGKLSKTLLAQAVVVSQVDQKFILAKVPTTPYGTADNSPSYSLLIIDQHAADERCRVEALMRGYFQLQWVENRENLCSWVAVTEALDQPLRFDVTYQDAVVLKAIQSFFEHWGIFYTTAPQSEQFRDGGSEAASQRIEVTKLPPSILERCRAEPRLLIDLLREEAWKLHESHKLLLVPAASTALDHTPENAADEDMWLSRLHGCPRGILDMINSRACRSAIMFNDVLSHEKCQDILSRLSTCALPFQCAHGRPSVVPLVGIGMGSGEAFDDSRSKLPLGRALSKWTKDNP